MLTPIRNMTTRVGNLILAAWFFLMTIWPDNWRFVTSAPPPPAPAGPMPIYGVVFTWLVYIWFVSAIFLFFRSRLAWFGSLSGILSAGACFASVIVSAFREWFWPNAEVLRDRANAGTVTSTLGYFLFLGLFCVCLTVSVGLFVGLLKMRRNLRWI